MFYDLWLILLEYCAYSQIDVENFFIFLKQLQWLQLLQTKNDIDCIHHKWKGRSSIKIDLVLLISGKIPNLLHSFGVLLEKLLFAEWSA